MNSNSCSGNYKPRLSRWEVQVKHAGGWRRYPMEVSALTDLDAAKDVRNAWGKYKLVRVRCAEFPDKFRKFRFVKDK